MDILVRAALFDSRTITEEAGGVWEVSTNYQLSTVNYQLSTVNRQPSTVNRQRG
ncbi:MAG: hypothetical protein QNJ36_19455 [Calothrix sp. MO_167.B42]|nr:hypothetical protein [Calothrix sp. MO_167.B42]